MTVYKFKRRVIKVGWKHREDDQDKYALMTKPNGYSLDLELNEWEYYELKELMDIIIEAYIIGKPSVGPKIRGCVDVRLGFYNNNFIDAFLDKYGNPCSFWLYVKNMRETSRNTKFYLLTTERHSSEFAVSQRKPDVEDSPLAEINNFFLL